MISHRQIMTNIGAAVCASDTVKNYCITNFGQGLAVHVGAYANAIPGEDDSPFLWIYADGDNDSVKTDETFTVNMVVGGCVKSSNGEQIIETVTTTRTASVNGLTVNGGNKIVEDLRDIIMGVIRDSKAGGIVTKMTRRENDVSHFPLEWAEISIDYLEPVAL